MRIIYVEVSPTVIKLAGGQESFSVQEPEPMIVQMLESPNAVYSETDHGPVGLHLLVLVMEKYIKIMQECVSRHEVVRLKHSKLEDNSSMEHVYNLLKTRLSKAEENLNLFKEAKKSVANYTIASRN